jgi:hypothetical protein
MSAPTFVATRLTLIHNMMLSFYICSTSNVSYVELLWNLGWVTGCSDLLIDEQKYEIFLVKCTVKTWELCHYCLAFSLTAIM